MLGVSCGLWDLGCILQDLSLQCLGSGVVACGLSFPMPCGILGFSGDSVVKNPPRMQETWVWSLVGKILWRRTWQPTPVFLPVESHGQRSLADFNPWGLKVEHDWVQANISFDDFTDVVLPGIRFFLFSIPRGNFGVFRYYLACGDTPQVYICICLNTSSCTY